MSALQTATRRYRAAEANAQAAREAWYDAMRDAHDEGMSYRAIAAETGLSFPRVQQIVSTPRP